MSCQQLRLQIIEDLDRGNTELSEPRLRDHLASCSFCRLFREEQLEISRLMEANLPDLEPSPVLWMKIQAKLDLERNQVRTSGLHAFFDWLRVPALRAVTAAVALVLVLSLALLRLPESPVESDLLAELESYHLEIRDNPFMPREEASNPFVNLSTAKGNPFQSVRSQR